VTDPDKFRLRYGTIHYHKSINSVKGICTVTSQVQFIQTLKENIMNMQVRKNLNYKRIPRSLTYIANELLDCYIISN
jgi:hypothetical protein